MTINLIAFAKGIENKQEREIINEGDCTTYAIYAGKGVYNELQIDSRMNHLLLLPSITNTLLPEKGVFL